jgi:hypothetical protein
MYVKVVLDGDVVERRIFINKLVETVESIGLPFIYSATSRRLLIYASEFLITIWFKVNVVDFNEESNEPRSAVMIKIRVVSTMQTLPKAIEVVKTLLEKLGYRLDDFKLRVYV